MAKVPFQKFKVGMMKTSDNLPRPASDGLKKQMLAGATGGAAPHQAPGLAGIRPKRKNNPLKSMLAPQKPFGQ